MGSFATASWHRLDQLARRTKRKWFADTRRVVKIGRHRLRNAPIVLVNLTRKAGRRIWAWRKPILRWRVRGHKLREQLDTYREEWRVERELERVLDGSDPIVIGPWLSEVGYEVLYWIPFIRWVKAAYRLKADRLVVVSRGGVACWYEDITSSYFDMFDQFDPREFAVRNLDRAAGDGTVKQYARSPLDEEVLKHVARALGASRVSVLHPSLMYRLFKQFWSGHRPLGFMDSHTRYARISPPRLADLTGLPDEYIAVKFYSAMSLPDTASTRRVLRALVDALAPTLPIVVLNTGLGIDDHQDYEFGGGRVIDARAWLTPKHNLGAQTQIIAGAKAFVGTCGSVAWLAPMLGVDTLAVLADAKFLHAHLQVARRVFYLMKAGRFTPFDVSALDSLGLTLVRASDRSANAVAIERVRSERV